MHDAMNSPSTLRTFLPRIHGRPLYISAFSQKKRYSPPAEKSTAPYVTFVNQVSERVRKSLREKTVLVLVATVSEYTRAELTVPITGAH